jgi:hypothetical protein
MRALASQLAKPQQQTHWRGLRTIGRQLPVWMIWRLLTGGCWQRAQTNYRDQDCSFHFETPALISSINSTALFVCSLCN